MLKENSVTIEERKKFSESLFWQGQRNFYHEKGAKAWTSEVPFYITSNPYIANCYANLIFRFFQDWLQHSPDAESHPFYILELGTGTGQFSFYLLKTLTKLLKHFKLNKITFLYIMSDFTKNNLEFWQQHPQLKPFISEKILDFALFDIEKDTTLTTTIQQKNITPNTCYNPLIVIANYLFDSVINDIFYVRDHHLYESLVTLKTDAKNIKNNLPKNWKKVVIQHANQSVRAPYYKDNIMNQLLKLYTETLDKGYVLFPTGCLHGLKNLKALCNDRLLLLSSDKGHTLLQELKDQAFPEIDFHGSFSLMVNYHAIAEFFKMNKGSAFLQSPRDGLTSAVFSSGFKLSRLPEVAHLLDDTIEGFGPTDFFNYYELMETLANQTELKNIASTLCLSSWDPLLFEQINERITQLLVKEETEIVDYVLGNLNKIADNFYFTPGCDDVFFSLGYALYAVDHFDEAIDYFKKSLFYFSNSIETLYNLSLCYFYKKDYSNAIAMLEVTLTMDPANKEAKSLLKSSKLKFSGYANKIKK